MPHFNCALCHKDLDSLKPHVLYLFKAKVHIACITATEHHHDQYYVLVLPRKS